MSGANDEDTTFVDRIVGQATEVREKMDHHRHESGEILRLLIKRLELYSEALKMPLLNKYTKIMFSFMRSDVVNELEFFKTRKDFEDQVSQIITGLDTMEKDVKSIKDKLNTEKDRLYLNSDSYTF